MRYLFIDNLRGIAFLLMIIHHIFYFKDVSNDYSTSYADNIFVKSSGIVARTLFIFLVGLSLSISEKNKTKESMKKRVKRSTEILINALIISFMTYMFYPNIFVKFGILHFISLVSLLGSYFVDKKKLTLICIFIFALILQIGCTAYINSVEERQLYPVIIWSFIGPFMNLPFIALIADADTWNKRIKVSLAAGIGYSVGAFLIMWYLRSI